MTGKMLRRMNVQVALQHPELFLSLLKVGSSAGRGLQMMGEGRVCAQDCSRPQAGIQDTAGTKWCPRSGVTCYT